MRYQDSDMNLTAIATHLAGRALPLAGLFLLAPALSAHAAIVAEGTYTVSAPEKRVVPFRMVLTATGARVNPAQGETMIFSYEKKSALILDADSRSYFLLPLEFIPPLLAAGLGYDARGLGAAATGATRTFLGTSCGEVVVRGNAPRFTLRSWRTTDPEWSRDYARLEVALGLPWTSADPPPVFLGLPLAGSLDIEGTRPYRASWEITSIKRDERAAESFTVPRGYRMDLERLGSLQGVQR